MFKTDDHDEPITEEKWRRLFAERVRKKLRDHHMTQHKLAKQIGTTDAAISRYLKGKRSPDIDVIIRMALVFGCTTDELVDFGRMVRVKEKRD